MAALQKLKEANAAGVVLGLKAISNVIPRKDIDVLIRDDPDAFNLFLLALAALQEVNF